MATTTMRRPRKPAGGWTGRFRASVQRDRLIAVEPGRTSASCCRRRTTPSRAHRRIDLFGGVGDVTVALDHNKQDLSTCSLRSIRASQPRKVLLSRGLRGPTATRPPASWRSGGKEPGFPRHCRTRPTRQRRPYGIPTGNSSHVVHKALARWQPDVRRVLGRFGSLEYLSRAVGHVDQRARDELFNQDGIPPHFVLRKIELFVGVVGTEEAAEWRRLVWPGGRARAR